MAWRKRDMGLRKREMALLKGEIAQGKLELAWRKREVACVNETWVGENKKDRREMVWVEKEK